MKLPAVALAAAFAAGIVFGHAWFVRHSTSFLLAVRLLALASVLLLALGFALIARGRLAAGASAGLLSWMVLGALAMGIASEPLPATHVLRLLETHQLDISTPLRWQGRLRDEPRKLPWGYGMEMELEAVAFKGARRACQGGLRLTYAPGEPPEPLPELHAGDEVELTTRARQPASFRDEEAFDRRAYLSSQGIDLVGTLRAPELIERTAAAPFGLRDATKWMQARLRDKLDALFRGTPEAASVLRAMLLGDRSYVDRAESRAFQATGTYHVIVIAGLHVSALAFFLYFCGRVLRLSRALTSVLTLGLLLSYVAVVELRPPVVRATLMAGVLLIGRVVFRRLDLLNSAAVAALLILVARPAELFDASFQLSFLAMACIGGLAAPWLERTAEPYTRALRGWRDVTRDAAHAPKQAQFRIDLRSLDRWLAGRLPQAAGAATAGSAVMLTRVSLRVWEVFVLSLILQAGMLPMMAQEFHRITLAGPFANLIAVPMTGVLVPLGFLTLGAALLYQRAAMLLAVPLSWLTQGLLRFVGWFASFPRWSYRIPGPTGWLVLAFFAAFVALCAAMRLNRRRAGRVALAGLILSGGAIAIYPFAPRFARGALEVTVLDVGQGDSILVVSPRGHTTLIDGGGAFGGFRLEERNAGPDPGEDAVSPYLWFRGFQKLDVVALTHAHQDHIGGLRAILENFQVKELWIGREVQSRALTALEELAGQRGIPVIHESRGASFDWDGVRGSILWPESRASEDSAPPKNNDSLVMRLAYGRHAVFLPGDAEREVERQILTDDPGAALEADVLKVAHHGGKNSTVPEFLERVHPKLAMISAGEDNPYGHPSPELLERLREAGARILRTDQNGAIHVVTNGESLQVSCYVACPETPSPALTRAQPADRNKQH